MVKILWVDDEIELLKPHVLFLKAKGYEVDTCNNGYDAHRHGRVRPPYDLHYSRRDDARHDGTRDAASHKGGEAHHTRHHGDQERGGEYHG